MVTNKIKNQIISYCKEIMKTLNVKYLHENDIYENEFLDYLFANCLYQYEKTKSYELNSEDLAVIFTIKKESEFLLKKIKNKEIDIDGLDKDDNIIILNK